MSYQNSPRETVKKLALAIEMVKLDVRYMELAAEELARAPDDEEERYFRILLPMLAQNLNLSGNVLDALFPEATIQQLEQFVAQGRQRIADLEASYTKPSTGH